jgi:serine/threonine protein kinase
LSEARVRREVEANLDTQNHDRIVRLLTAFSYRERFYLIFPLATEGSLEKLWKEFVPEGIAQQSTEVRVAQWYSDEWLIGECLGIAEALLAVHGLVNDRPEGREGLLHADIKPENILCFSKPDDRNTSIVLKLADFGEAKRVNADLKASKVAHGKTYRPPEHYSSNAITLNYDVWCLGCLFLDFITWAILGQDGIDDFIRERTDEPEDLAVTKNPGQIIEDTFFKRTKKEPVPFILKRLHWGRKCDMEVDSIRATTIYSLWTASHLCITSRLKDAVVSVSKLASFFPSLQRYI